MGLVPLEATALPQPWVSAFQIRRQVLPYEPPPPAITLFFQVKSQRLPSSYLGGNVARGIWVWKFSPFPLPIITSLSGSL